MNIEKLKNFNQVMLSILAVLLIVMVTIGLAFVVNEVVQSFRPYNGSHDSGLLADTRVDQLSQQNLRKQIISYSSPELIDSLNLVYFIRVGFKNLDKPEFVEDDLSPLLNTYKSGSRVYRKEFYGSFSNLLVYDYLQNKTEKVIESRLLAHDLAVFYFDDDIVCVFSGAEKDTNKDGEITLSDCKSLYVFSLKDRKPRKMGLENATLVSYHMVEGKKDILATFRLDRNLDGKFNVDTEPTVVMKYDYYNNLLVNIVDEESEKELQRIIDRL
jgi:hypothetical protein